MRIVVDPGELAVMAAHATEASAAYAEEATALLRRELPPMPPHVARNVMSGVERAAASLEALAVKLDAEALGLRMRAAIASGDAVAFPWTAWSRVLSGLESATAT